MAYIKATNAKEARHWFYENYDDKVITNVKRGSFSHIDKYDDKPVYNYKIEWKKREGKRRKK